MFYLRKINSDVWFVKDALDADCISDLRTIKNEVSVWQLDDACSDIDQLVLAIALTRDEVSELYVAKLKDSDLTKLQMTFKNGVGNSNFFSYNDRHTNILANDIWDLGYLAEYISNLLKADEYVYYSEDKIIEMLAQRIENQIIPWNDVKSLGKIKKRIKEYAKEVGSVKLSQMLA